jgi:hypothetical protein
MERPQPISNSDLRPSDVPPPNAEWEAISRFALTFNGYEQAGSFAAAGRIANEHQCSTLNDLRICLFFEQRRWHHFGGTPDGKALEYIRTLVERIRQRVDEGNLD